MFTYRLRWSPVLDSQAPPTADTRMSGPTANASPWLSKVIAQLHDQTHIKLYQGQANINPPDGGGTSPRRLCLPTEYINS